MLENIDLTLAKKVNICPLKGHSSNFEWNIDNVGGISRDKVKKEKSKPWKHS